MIKVSVDASVGAAYVRYAAIDGRELRQLDVYRDEAGDVQSHPVSRDVHHHPRVIVDVDERDDVFGIELLDLTEEGIALARDFALSRGLQWPKGDDAFQ